MPTHELSGQHSRWIKQHQVPIGFVNAIDRPRLAIYLCPSWVLPECRGPIHLCPSWVLRPEELLQIKGTDPRVREAGVPASLRSLCLEDHLR